MCKSVFVCMYVCNYFTSKQSKIDRFCWRCPEMSLIPLGNFLLDFLIKIVVYRANLGRVAIYLNMSKLMRWGCGRTETLKQNSNKY